jgi:NAD(P)-dependent dehydrogenase (short-subunit alcohol dehydrogenase family)
MAGLNINAMLTRKRRSFCARARQFATMDSMEALAGKKALVTGAAKRIGRVLALRLAEAGADVAITYRMSEAEAGRTVAELEDRGVRGVAVHAELRNPESISAAVARAERELGGLDLLINNAGSFETEALERISVAQWDAMFDTNTRAPFLVAQAAYPMLSARGGRIINIGSLGGQLPWATHGHYCASKAALHMLTQTMAKAWAPEIAVNCVAPGMIVMGEISAGYEHFIAKTPMQRNGTADDVAEAVMFFATATRFITGQVLSVDGGLGL